MTWPIGVAKCGIVKDGLISYWTFDEAFSTAGLIDEVSVYNRTLSADEVEQNFNAEGLAVNSVGKVALTWGAIKSSN